jgi:cation/acetate symporter
MVSTTWVQFIKGSLLVVFCLGLVVGILNRGIPSLKSEYRSSVQAPQPGTWTPSGVAISDARILEEANLKLTSDFFNMQSVGPFEFITQLGQSEILKTTRIAGPKSTGGDANQQPLTINVTQANRGESYLLPGGYFKGIRSDNLVDRLDFASLMLALFCGTAALPHILIRYYTVKDAAAARKSTVVGIIAIGFFYILTLYIGLGAMVSGNLDPADSNMAAPLLAKTFGEVPFAIISAIAFTTVLGTVSGLILAASGAVAQDLLTTVRGVVVSDRDKVRSAKIASVVVGVVAIVLGIVFKNFSAAFLVGWAFNIAASANLPAIVMILFWRGTTRQGIIASIVVGLLSSLIWLSLTKEAMLNIYNNFGATFTAADAIAPFSQPGLVTIPLAFIVLIIVSLMTRSRTDRGFDVSARQ